MVVFKQTVVTDGSLPGHFTALAVRPRQMGRHRRQSLSQASRQTAAPPAKPKKIEPLSEFENPEMIGKRNINKMQINFYNFDKEVAIGRQFAREVDQSAKLVEDPVIVEYINKVGQNLVLHSDAKVPFTIKVIDADEINAFALPGGFFYVNKGLILAAENESELGGSDGARDRPRCGAPRS
jgi:predicted Zn-dependent protease